MLTAVLALTSAWAICEAQVSNAQLAASIDGAEALWRSPEDAPSYAAIVALRAEIECLGEPIEPALAFRVHRLVACGFVYEHNLSTRDPDAPMKAERAAVGAMRAALREDPTAFDGYLSAEDVPLLAQISAENLARAAREVPATWPPGWTLIVDGQVRSGTPGDSASILQYRAEDGTIRRSTYHDLGSAMPVESSRRFVSDALAEVEGRERAQRLNLGLGVGVAVAGSGAMIAYGVAWHHHNAMQIAQSDAEITEHWQSARNATVASAALGGVGLALTVPLVVGRRR